MGGPLEGFRVIELTSTVSGPLAGMILGDQGADVIKVEPPGIGDLARFMGDSRNGMAAMYATLNRNKRSLVLDLKDAADIAVLNQLVETADVLIENYRPGIVKRLGIDYDAHSKINPGLVYCSVSGYGQSGPYRDRKVYDPLIQATVGTAREQHPNDPHNIRTVIFDKVTGYTVAQSVTAALLQRSKTGRGQYLPISMMQSALYYQWPDVMWSRMIQEDGSHHFGELADYFQLYQTKNGYIAIILIADDVFAHVCELVGSTAHTEERFLNFPNRLENREELREELAKAFSDWTSEALSERFDELGVPCAVANTLDDIHEDPQVIQQGGVIEVEHPIAGRLRMASTPFQFEGQIPLQNSPAASLGQHSEEILSELGVAQSDVERILARLG